jgi:cyclophilin family peptidyl-prolyl cis-trans isomerase
MSARSLSRGTVTFRLLESWSPHGTPRAINLFGSGFFNDAPLFRVVPDFLVQFGVAATPELNRRWDRQQVPDDPQWLDGSFPRAYLSFAGNGENSRNTHMFVSYQNSTGLGTRPWEVPVGYVESGMSLLDTAFSYGDLPPWGKGADPGRIFNEGISSEYVQGEFPKMNRFGKCEVSWVPVEESSNAEVFLSAKEGEREGEREGVGAADKSGDFFLVGVLLVTVVGCAMGLCLYVQRGGSVARVKRNFRRAG